MVLKLNYDKVSEMCTSRILASQIPSQQSVNFQAMMGEEWARYILWMLCSFEALTAAYNLKYKRIFVHKSVKCIMCGVGGLAVGVAV